MAASGLTIFSKSPDHAVWLHFNGYQRRLYVVGAGQASLPIEALSGGGQTNAENMARRQQVEKKHHSHVPTYDFPFNPFQGASRREVSVTDHYGKHKTVHAGRGGVLPPGDWIAVAKGTADYRHPSAKLATFQHGGFAPIALRKSTRRSVGSTRSTSMSPDFWAAMGASS